MTEVNDKILDLIKKNRSMKEISSIFNISEKQLYIRIKQIINNGYQLSPIYFSNSQIYYKVLKKPITEKENFSILMADSKNEFRAIAISDMHIGNQNSNIELCNQVYEYAVNNGINIIFNCGDTIEGDYTSDKKNIPDVESQIEYLLKKYPYDKSINNFMILGNHDYHSLNSSGLDVLKKISNARHDFISVGYGQGCVKLKSDSITMTHKLSDNVEKLEYESDVILSGHGHQMKTKFYDKLFICIPSLSYVCPNKTNTNVPGFVDMQISFDKGKIGEVDIKHLIFSPKPVQVSESKCLMKHLVKKFDNQVSSEGDINYKNKRR